MTIDEIVYDLSTQVKSTNDELPQQPLSLKKLQEDNHSLHKKNAKLSETKEDLLRKQTELEREFISLREQVMNLQQKPDHVSYKGPRPIYQTYGQCARLRSERSGFEPWSGILCCVLGQHTLQQGTLPTVPMVYIYDYRRL